MSVFARIPRTFHHPPSSLPPNSCGAALARSLIPAGPQAAGHFNRRLEVMKRIIVAMVAMCAFALIGTPAAAQQTTGNIQGRITDAQKAAVPGVTVTAKSASTGFTRAEVHEPEGVYRVNAVAVGTYGLDAELSGFAPYDRKDVIVNIGTTVDLNFDLNVAGVSEQVKVTAESPLIQTSSSSVGGVVDIKRIENLPLNGRQFANLAATVPGVGLGFHSDPTKSTQYSPQINGGGGPHPDHPTYPRGRDTH